AAVEKEYGPALKGEEPTELFVVELAGEAIGFVQRYRIADYPHWVDALSVAGTPSDAAGIDYLLGREELTGRGVGAEMIVQFSDDTLRRYPDVSAIVVDVDQENRRSWRSLEQAVVRFLSHHDLLSSLRVRIDRPSAIRLEGDRGVRLGREGQEDWPAPAGPRSTKPVS